MKIAFLETDPSFGGGSEQVCLDLAEQFSIRGHQIYLIYSIHGSMMNRYLTFTKDTCQMELYPFGWRSVLASTWRALKLSRLFTLWDLDWLVTSNPKYIPLLSITRLKSKTKLCFHLGLPGTNGSRWMRSAMGRIDCAISPSDHTAASWLENGWPSHRLHVVANGVNLKRFGVLKPDANVIRKNLGIDTSTPIVAYVGRLAPEKGIGTLLRAFSELADHHSSAVLLLAGRADNAALDWPTFASELQIRSNRIRFLGPITDPERVYAIADIVVAPSECPEAFGLTAVEAMASQKTVIASDVGIFPSLLQGVDQRLIFPATDVKALSSRMNYWLSHESERQRVARRLHSLAHERFSLASMAENYECLLSRP